MSDGTHIEWTDVTWNLVNGCDKVSPGCRGCYAIRDAWRLAHNPNSSVAESRAGLVDKVHGKLNWTGEVLFNRAVALLPFELKKPRRIFVCAAGDLFHEKVPEEWIDYVFMAALLNPQHTLQILTKRQDRMHDYMLMVQDEPELHTAARIANAMRHAGKQDTPADTIDVHWPPRNCWLGVSVEDQRRADERVPALLETPAAVRWLSCEPLLGPIELPKIDWVVVGGESGPGARPMHPDWARSLRDQCAAAGVPFLFKQWGSWAPSSPVAGGDLGGDMRRGIVRIVKARGESDGHFRQSDAWMRATDKKNAGRLLDGRTWDQYPA